MPPQISTALKNRHKLSRYLKSLARFLFSTLGLCLLVMSYSVGGIFLFQYIEATGEIQRKVVGVNFSHQMEEIKASVYDQLLGSQMADNFNETLKQVLNDYHQNFTDGVNNYDYKGVERDLKDMTLGWSFPSTFLFTVTIVTTIGYGHIYPVTPAGQITVIIYAMIGIPLMLMFLANIGDAMASAFRTTYSRGCCLVCRRKRLFHYRRSREAPESDSPEPFEMSGPLPIQPEVVQLPGAVQIDYPTDQLSMDLEAGEVDPNHLDPQRSYASDQLPAYLNSSLQSSVSFGANSQNANGAWVSVAPSAGFDDMADVANVPISLVLLVIAVYILIGGGIFSVWNGWTLVQSTYFSFVTLSTIGFGDLVPGLHEVGSLQGNLKMAASGFYIILGLAVLSMSFNLMMEEMLSKFKSVGTKIGIVDDPHGKRLFHSADPVVSAKP